jgi:hypothetical protein
MPGNLWFLLSPSDSDDYQHAYVHGEVEYVHHLPATSCSDCSRPVATYSVLPFGCPEELRTEKLLTTGLVSPQTYDALRKQIAARLNAEQEAYLQPGAAFMPGLLDVPSKPRADFLWAELGGPLVSERVREAITRVCADDVYFTDISYRRVGRRSAKALAPIPNSGEPEDVIHTVPLTKSVIGLPAYSRLNVRQESALPADARDSPICPGCGRPKHPTREARPAMTLSMWRGHNLFYLATTLNIVVTSRVREALEAIGATNVSFEPAAA